MPPLRWGIAGAGKISHDFVNALETLSPDHKVIAVGASDAAKATAFAKEFSIPKSYGSYEQLFKDAEVDVIYIGTINTTHYELSKAALENNKHVLCEKTLTLMLEHTLELVKLSQQKKLFFQEAIWSRFFPSYSKLREEVKAGAIGDVKLATVNFGIKIADMDRVFRKELGGGSLMDIGIYALQFVVSVFGPEMPEVKAVGVLNSEGCDMATGISLLYKDGRIGQVTTNTFVESPNEAAVYGTKGSAKLPRPFWAAHEVVVNGVSTEYPLPTKAKRPFFYGNETEGLVYEAEEVKRCLSLGLLASPLMTQEETVTLARIQDAVKKQIGVSYDELYKK